ncbi:hypothetical protein ACZ75_15485 [Massilia sp. NR 4-1]|nr:hypothetical protein ACZ75_15485 [Massilia sp. NR 4-1]
MVAPRMPTRGTFTRIGKLKADIAIRAGIHAIDFIFESGALADMPDLVNIPRLFALLPRWRCIVFTIRTE